MIIRFASVSVSISATMSCQGRLGFPSAIRTPGGRAGRVTRGIITLTLHTAGYVSVDFTIRLASEGLHGYNDSPHNPCRPDEHGLPSTDWFRGKMGEQTAQTCANAC